MCVMYVNMCICGVYVVYVCVVCVCGEVCTYVWCVYMHCVVYVYVCICGVCVCVVCGVCVRLLNHGLLRLEKVQTACLG